MNYTIDFLQNQGFILTLLHKGQFMKKDTIFWDVDTQFDFMRPKGKLYVTGASEKQILDILFEPIYVSYG